jgi:UTP-glucose-1-phosphate uridylyltransferase
MIYVSYVRQKEALGLGHAILTARELVGNEPFAVLLADDVIDAKVPVLKQTHGRFQREAAIGHRNSARQRAGHLLLWRHSKGKEVPGHRRQALRSA